MVLLNWNGLHWLQQFLPGVAASTWPATTLLLVDNASTDGSVAWVQQHYPQVRIVINEGNLGFAEGNNRALPHIATPYFVLLNTDVEVPPGWLEPLVAHMQAHPRCGACQPKLLCQADRRYFEYAGGSGGLMDAAGIPFCRGRLLDTLEADTGQYQDARQVFWASGACILLRTAAVASLAELLDPRYFAHMEEIDLCWRLQLAGWQVWAVPASQVYHVGGGTLPKTSPRKTYLNVRNSIFTLFKNATLPHLLAALVFRLALDHAAVASFVLKGQWNMAGAVIRAWWAVPGSLGWLLAKRSHHKPRPLRQLAGVYTGSVVCAYFVRRQRHYSQLPSQRITSS